MNYAIIFLERIESCLILIQFDCKSSDFMRAMFVFCENPTLLNEKSRHTLPTFLYFEKYGDDIILSQRPYC